MSDDIFDTPIDINAETLRMLAPMWQMTIHGDYYDPYAEKYAWDLEFPSMLHAAKFADVCAKDFQSIDFRSCDRIDSLHKRVTLTAVEREPRTHA